MSDEKKSFTLFRAAWTALKAGIVVAVLGLAVLAINQAEVARQDPSKTVGMAHATVARANVPAEAVYLPTRR